MADQKGSEVILITPQESKYWEIVQAVNEQFKRGVTTTREACKRAGVGKTMYYEAMHSKYVQLKRVEQIRGLTDASVAIVVDNWLPVLHNIVAIATGEKGSDRDAALAARLVKEVYDDLRELMERGEAETSNDAAATFLEQFGTAPSKRRYRAKRKRGDIEEEIELDFPVENAGEARHG
jgi:hypothetical protein